MAFEDVILNFIGNYAFPIVVALFYMLKLENTLDKLSVIVDRNNDLIEKLCLQLPKLRK